MTTARNPIGTLVTFDELHLGDSIFVPGVGEGNVVALEGPNEDAGSLATIVTDLGEIAVFEGELFDRVDTSPFRGEALTLFEVSS